MANVLTEFPYLYETHMHTEEASRCGKVSGAEMARLAKEYAATYGLPGTAGSDMHRAELLGGGVAFREKLNSVQDFIRKIKSGKGYVITDGVNWYDPQGNPVDR